MGPIENAIARKAIEVVLRHEGGYVNDPLDAAGETNFGISKRSYPDLDIANLTREQAIEIYYRDWWLQYSLDQIKYPSIATKVLDLCVNMGPSQGIEILQQALHATRQRQVVVDGVIGPQTLNAANRAHPYMLMGALRVEAAHFYRQLVDRRPSQKRFLNGWLNRAYF